MDIDQLKARAVGLRCISGRGRLGNFIRPLV